MRRKSIALGALFAFGFAGSAVAQQCGGDFNAWREGVRQEAAADGIGERGLSALNGAGIEQKVLQRDRAQGVFNQTFAEFAGRMINDYRLKNGAANLKKYANTFARAQNEFGVPGPVIASFWALETDFGAVQGDFSTLNALATLAHDCRRPEIFRPQLIALLHLIDQGWVPANVTGAWAGEIGQMQMLPSDYYTKGVDGDGDGKVDLKGSSPDAILTAAKNLQSLGWKPGQPWMEEVRVPDQMAWEKTGRVTKLPRSEWAAMGVTYRDGSPLPADGMATAVVLPMGHKGPAFLVYDNYDIYLEWNQSLIYTLTAAHLAARLAGAPRFDVRSPEKGLAPETMKQLQTKLAARGHDVGKIDGILGAGTREAVRQEQLRLGLPADGWPTPTLFSNL
ncbi:lytic murein transglycosylase [Nitratireductor aquimarinus]|uniref:Lytic murein transglycosylase n=1 Tax=Nitratireductor aquimarinus TaxID=889300 RepID=A0ABU4AFJ6_9HYPH|nr:lytic murein transglycosylase [Nitratireductor aquimarinus]MDV6225017.1 lytic murein transglycosylase [Nitratireductor aquimarinus]